MPARWLSESGHRVFGLIDKATVHPTHLKIALKIGELCQLLLPAEAMRPARDMTYDLEVPMQLRRRGVETKLVLVSQAGTPDARDEKLIQLIAQCHAWREDLIAGEVGSVREIAQRADLPECDASRFLPLGFLAPDIVDAILAGKQPIELTVERLKRLGTLPLLWEDQRKMLGLPMRAYA